MRHACFERLRKSGLLDEDSPMMAMIVKSSLFESKLSSLESHSCPM
jgi:hypothetical protein